MGEPDAALNVYMSKKERIRDVIEYYTGGEIPPDFEYRFRKSDHIEPVFGLKLYWGQKKLEIPKSLKDMMDMEWIPKHFMSMFSDYKVHTVSMLEIPDEALWKMESDIKYVVGVLKRTGAGRRYEQFILENKDYFERMPSDAYDVIRACANIRGIEKYLELKEENGEERVDMCRAIYEIKRDARREGMREGKREGKKEGKKEGEIYGIRRGRCEAIFDLLENCGEIPKEIRTKINREKDVEKLKVWLKLAARAETIEEFCMAM